MIEIIRNKRKKKMTLFGLELRAALIVLVPIALFLGIYLAFSSWCFSSDLCLDWLEHSVTLPPH